jgi:hypothetical protein
MPVGISGEMGLGGVALRTLLALALPQETNITYIPHGY